MSLNQNWELIKFLSRCNVISYKSIKISRHLGKALKEICWNLLYSDLPLNRKELLSLKTHKKEIKQISEIAPSRVGFKTLKAILRPTVRLFHGHKVRPRVGEVPSSDEGS